MIVNITQAKLLIMIKNIKSTNVFDFQFLWESSAWTIAPKSARTQWVISADVEIGSLIFVFVLYN